MLIGSFTHLGHTLELVVNDISNTFYITARTDDGSTVKFYDEGINVHEEIYPATWRYDGILITVGPSNISIQSFTEMDGEGKKFKNEINKDAFRELGSILRSLKNACTVKNRVEDSDEGFRPDKEYTYDIAGNSVTMRQGEVKAIEYVSEDFQDYEEGDFGWGQPRGEGSKLDLKTVRDSGEVISYFKNGHRVSLNTAMFEQPSDIDDLGIMALGDEEYYSIDEIVKMNPSKSYEWLVERNYHVVEPHEVVKVCRELYEHDGLIAFDTETTGLNINFRSREGYGDTLVGMVFTIHKNGANKTYYFPVDHDKIENIAPKSYMDNCIEKYFKPILELKDIVCHNASYDWKVMYLYDINLHVVHDTLTLTRLTIWNEDTSTGLGLKSLARRLLGRDSLELDDFVEGKWNSDSSFTELPKDSVKYYACADTDNTLDICNYYEENRTLERFEVEKVYEIEVMFSRAIGYSEYFGMYASPEDVNQLSKLMSASMEREMASMEALVGREFNPRSSKQLVDVMYNQLGIEIIKYTDSGNPSADKKTLEILAEKVDANGEPLYPFVKHLQEYRFASQLKSNFCDVFDKLSNEGFFHADVQQFLETGRVSIKEPNYQSFNDDVKQHIVPRDGFYMFDTDFSSIEYRVLVSIAGEQSLIDQFFDPDFDYHRRMASLLHDVPYEAVTHELRGQSKGLNFGIPYGMSVIGLAERMFGDKTDESISKAEILYNKYFDVQPSVKEFFNKTKDFAVSNGYNSTFFGRRRYYDARKNKVGRIRRQAGNHPIQGTAADLYKQGIGRLFMEIFKRGHDGKILIDAFVHDEVVIECHKSINPSEVMEIIAKSMMPQIPGWCPLYIGAGFGSNWFEAKSTELPVEIQDDLGSLSKSGGLDFWNGDTDSLVEWEKKAITRHAKDKITSFISEVVAKREDGDDSEINLPPAELGYLNDTLESLNNGSLESAIDVSEFHNLETEDQLTLLGEALGIEEEVSKADISTKVPEYEDTVAEVKVVKPEDLGIDEPDPSEMYKVRAKNMGCAIDFSSKKAYVYIKNKAVQAHVLNLINEDKKLNKGVNSLIVFTDDQEMETEHVVSNKFGSEVIKTYLK